MGRVAFSGQEYDLVCNFESVRKKLLQDCFSDRLAKPLAYWALPNDRRLPGVFLNQSVGELVNTSFEEISATPGIGEKKIGALLQLLIRASSEQPPSAPFELSDAAQSGDAPPEGGPPFNAFLVSEAIWSEWTATVRRLGLGDERLGRVALSLRNMPTVIWRKRLQDYVDLKLADIRRLRTHGEKRVRCVLQVFYTVHKALHQAGNETNTRRLLSSPRILSIADWTNVHGHPPAADEIRDRLARPILQQIEMDCGRTVHRLARQRLGVDTEAMGVRSQAQSIGVTRARVYQLLSECHRVIEVRWPDGKRTFDQLARQLGPQLASHPREASLFVAVRQLCFPDRHRVDSAPQ